MSYYIGQRVRVTATFRDESSVLTNPTTVVCRLRAPSGTTTIATTTNPSTGVYRIEKVVDASGVWSAEFTASGGIDAAGVTSFYVQPDEVG